MASTPRIPDWKLEELAAGALPAAEAQALRRAVERDPEAAARWAALQESSQQVLRELPASEVAREVRRRLERSGALTERSGARAGQQGGGRDARARGSVRSEGGSRWRMTTWVPAVAFAAVLVAVVAVETLRERATPQELAMASNALESTRAKGLRPTLHVYLQRGASVAQLGDQSEVSAGDLLQLRYLAAGRSFGAVISIDGRGEVSVHAPTSTASSFALRPDGERALPTAYELDAAPGFERFIFVTSSRPFSVEPVLTAARQLAATGDVARFEKLQLPAELEQTSILLLKVSR